MFHGVLYLRSSIILVDNYFPVDQLQALKVMRVDQLNVGKNYN